MIIKNPTNEKVTVGILGKEYSIDANETMDLPESIVNAWRRVHGFLQIVNEEVKEPEIIKYELSVSEEIKEDKEDKEVKEVKTVTRRGTKK